MLVSALQFCLVSRFFSFRTDGMVLPRAQVARLRFAPPHYRYAVNAAPARFRIGVPPRAFVQARKFDYAQNDTRGAAAHREETNLAS